MYIVGGFSVKLLEIAHNSKINTDGTHLYLNLKRLQIIFVNEQILNFSQLTQEFRKDVKQT